LSMLSRDASLGVGPLSAAATGQRSSSESVPAVVIASSLITRDGRGLSELCWVEQCGRALASK
jgi:hypothetical protein